MLWHNPGGIERINFTRAAGRDDPPRPPFRFVAEKTSGNTAKVIVSDVSGTEWRVKWGLEVKAESFATRLVGALGYNVAPTWFVARGKIAGAHSLARAGKFIRRDGSFTNASFERKDPSRQSLPEDWAWNKNPFMGTNELNGLKVVVMLVANWDNKDARDSDNGSNTGILQSRVKGRTQLIYGVSDWGQALGGWGPRLYPKTWDCGRFTTQTSTFLQGRKGEYLRFGFFGQHTQDFSNDITPANVRWLMRYLGKITDAQLRSGLKASGATPQEAACFATGLRKRIKQLGAV